MWVALSDERTGLSFVAVTASSTWHLYLQVYMSEFYIVICQESGSLWIHIIYCFTCSSSMWSRFLATAVPAGSTILAFSRHATISLLIGLYTRITVNVCVYVQDKLFNSLTDNNQIWGSNYSESDEKYTLQKNVLVLVRERTIPTERPQLCI
jgi:hypothetical protein